MPLIFGILIFILVTVGSAYVGLRIYVKPSEAIERVKGIDLHPAETPKHPSLLLRDFLLQLGISVPICPRVPSRTARAHACLRGLVLDVARPDV